MRFLYLRRLILPQSVRYWPRWDSTNRSGALETLITPSKGCSNSRIKKMDTAIDRAQKNRTVTTVALGGAKRPKLPKMTVSQNITAIRSIHGIVSTFPPDTSQRARIKLPEIISARDLNSRWASVCGDNSKIRSSIVSTANVDSATSIFAGLEPSSGHVIASL